MVGVGAERLYRNTDLELYKPGFRTRFYLLTQSYLTSLSSISSSAIAYKNSFPPGLLQKWNDACKYLPWVSEQNVLGPSTCSFLRHFSSVSSLGQVAFLLRTFWRCPVISRIKSKLPSQCSRPFFHWLYLSFWSTVYLLQRSSLAGFRDTRVRPLPYRHCIRKASAKMPVLCLLWIYLSPSLAVTGGRINSSATGTRAWQTSVP